MLSLLSRGDGPTFDNLSERRTVEPVKFRSSLSLGDDEACSLQHLEVLGDGLTRRADPMRHDEPGAEFEKRLLPALAELIQDGPTCRIAKGSVNVIFRQRLTPPERWKTIIGKSWLACQARDSASRIRGLSSRRVSLAVSLVRGRIDVETVE